MSEQTLQTKQAIEIVLALPPLEKIRLMERLAATLEDEWSQETLKIQPSLRGILAEFGPAPSAENIEEARKEMWADFPREDIA